jgi:hypothetical protein
MASKVIFVGLYLKAARDWQISKACRNFCSDDLLISGIIEILVV